MIKHQLTQYIGVFLCFECYFQSIKHKMRVDKTFRNIKENKI